MLNSVIKNLLSEAIKYSFMNSKIIISSKHDDKHEIIMIKDFGVGIDSAIIPKLFSLKYHISKERSYKDTGTGLGLLLCKELVEKK